MKIKEMFRDDIDRTINGVVQVEQEKEDVVKQEVKEYVVTSELKKHYTKFFNEYGESFDTPTDNVGVWITGFFGSGKSHFLKMLSYLLENKEIDGKKTIDYFEEKFDDQLSFMNIQKCVQVPTETILFNIDAEGSINKDDTAVLRVFAKVFYEHLGYYGKDLKLARFEQYLTSLGKMEEFKEAFKRNRGKSWEEIRSTYQFNKKFIINAAVECGAMDEENVSLWLSDKSLVDYSIEQFATEVKAYVDTKPKNFRLLFMIDEAGQYIGENGNMLLHLQTITEKLGSVCNGQVWVVATGQEALDDILIKVRNDQLSRIMARFPIRLSLTSSSVGEVIEKRLLTKTEDAKNLLINEYENNENTLKNLYVFDTEVKDIKGYKNADEFSRIYPFVPYQFIIMQKVFNEIRKHGHAGKHQSNGERSMLNGFQESVQRVENENELTLVSMCTFYDPLHKFLDSSVQSVIIRAMKAAENGDGLTVDDVNLLKLLYLVRYIDDVKSNIENLTILMADSIKVDKIELRQKVTESLNRLQKQNYIDRNGDIYVFLTDEEQDIARDINHQKVDASNVISEISRLIFDDIYTTKKFRYTKNNQSFDFDFDKTVDNQNHGISTGGMKLRFVTEAFDELDDLKLVADSKMENEAICKLSNEYSIFSDIEIAIKIDHYTRSNQGKSLSENTQAIIANKQNERRRLLAEAKEKISEAIIKGRFYIDGEILTIPGTSVKAVLDKALEKLADCTYSGITLINKSVTSDAEIRNILNGEDDRIGEDTDPNFEACNEMYRYLEKQAMAKMPISVADLQSRYQAIPYGWKEIDIAAVIAKLVHEQRITIKHAGETIQPNDYRLIDYLRKRTEIGSTLVSIRETIPIQKMNTVRKFLKDYFNEMNIPSDEDGLISYITKKFEDEKYDLVNMQDQNIEKKHPGSYEIDQALEYVCKVHLAEKDNIALINTICDLGDDLLDSKEDMQQVKNFYSSQIKLYDSAVDLKRDVLQVERDYLFDIPTIKNEIEKIEDITKVTNKFRYNRIPELNDCISIIKEERSKVVSSKKDELNALIDSCLNEVRLKASSEDKLKAELENAERQFEIKRKEVSNLDSLVSLDAKKNTIISLKDSEMRKMDSMLHEQDKPTEVVPQNKPKKVRQLDRVVIFNQANLNSKEDIDRYVQNIKNKLLSFLNDDDEIQIK